MSLSLAQIRAFNAVAETGSFTKAAAALGLSQPAVTMQVRQIEDAWRTELFIRSGNQVRLTDLGRRLHRITGQIGDLEEVARAILADDPRLGGQVLRLSMASPQIFMPVVAGFKARHPAVHIEVSLGSTGQAVEEVVGRVVDIGLTPLLEPDDRLECLPYTTHGLIVITPSRHPWTGRSQVPLAEVAKQPLIFRSSGSTTQQLVDRSLRSRRLKALNTLVLGSREGVVEAVANGLGIALMLERDTPPDPRLARIPLADAAAEEHVSEQVIWLRHRSPLPLVEAFAAFAREAARTAGE